VIKDVSLALPPLNRLLARRAIEETRISKAFEGYRDIKKIDLEVLEEILIRMSRLVTDFPEIREADINPVKVVKGKVVAAHGRVIVERTDLKAASHLIISPYPFWQEKIFRLKDGTDIFVRPVRPSDAQQMIDLFDDLSPETIYLRFFSPIKRISRSMLIKLTQIDYDREIALIAFSGPEQERKILGVARIIFLPDGRHAEFAIVLADAWQGKGIGGKLLHHALVCAAAYGIEEVWGPVISSNTGMLRLGEKLGFRVERDMDTSEYRLAIELSGLRKPLLNL
jgi:acetyltransferase